MNKKSIQNRSFYPEASDKQGFIAASDKNGWASQGAVWEDTYGGF